MHAQAYPPEVAYGWNADALLPSCRILGLIKNGARFGETEPFLIPRLP